MNELTTRQKLLVAEKAVNILIEESESVGKENRQLRQQLETATALLKKVHEDATPMSGGYRGYLVDGSTISAIGMLMKAREVTE